MNTIHELIAQYKQIATSYYDDLVTIELEKIAQLFDRYQDSAQDIFVCEMMQAFSNIIDRQKERILDFGSWDLSETQADGIVDRFCRLIQTQRELIGYLEQPSFPAPEGDPDPGELRAFSGPQAPTHGFLSCPTSDATGAPQNDFQNDKQLQAAFTAHCLENASSSYTVNDYCSRIKNLWKSYYSEYLEGKLTDELAPDAKAVDPACPLLNVYRHTQVLDKYISEKIARTAGNRNWTNARAAFHKLDKFKRARK